MLQVTQELAQDIVTRMMKVIGYNVNVMDERGYIIASGDKNRLHQKHEGAVIAIERRGRFEVYPEDVRRLVGVQAGTNLVIQFQNEIVGVIGITGDPREVTKYGELVKMTAEMFLEQSYLLEQAKLDKRLREDFLLSIIHSDHQDCFLWKEQARRLQIDLSIKRVAVVIELVDIGISDDSAYTTLRQMVGLLELRDTIEMMAIKNSKQIVLVKESRHYRDKEAICEGVEQILQLLKNQLITPIKISVGKAFSGVEGLRYCYESARDTLVAGKAMAPELTVYYYDDFLNETLMVSVQESWKSEELIKVYKNLITQDKSGELQQTLHVYMEEEGELHRIAKRLVIHRNTLRYRLQRIYDITGKDPKRISDFLSLQFAMWLYKLKNKQT
ncbi:carbohydrate diacid regulator [Brevibacillus laterosporus]|uniref:Sugar diacid regulator n=1 Tax=Brevibacillus laterosporus LMG 15441 TaxID=1042163 RepID=A0A075R8D3_BRELA|nr:sugar diacid recognition domain-containing protein [Brevibacillus laterosporus]WPS87093.1 sugar diacid recognition domain-containing protein [Brevibacillus halotolerans]HAS00810.1 carbohydrate diacid regulator [Brevibacillus sp.]AIG28114.1 sugar diacid regulator [Brevibacillus laterosporus LMG 15441]RJL09945.1 carbohydrate diacid regulator [Brevibacillus laterosporus]TPH08510.1 carbohydrate diacid regulator [Brevibacillus laterosporus]